MQKRISFKEYNFRIILEGEKDDYSFEIIAYDKVNNTKSSITNLNFIISELIEPITSNEDYESFIDVNKKKGKEMFNRTIEHFNDEKWFSHLIDKIEEDKLAGVWSK